MDFSFSPEQIELRDLARQILTDRCQHEHLAEVAATESATDLELWRTLADAGLVGIGLPGVRGWRRLRLARDRDRARRDSAAPPRRCPASP